MLLIEIVLVLLLIAVCLNLALTLRLAKIVREGPADPSAVPQTLELNEPISAFSGRRLGSSEVIGHEQIKGMPAVLVFLSSGCSDCKQKVPELIGLLPAMEAKGVRLLLLSSEREARVQSFVGSTPLGKHAVVLEHKQLQRLNPRNASPFYVFVDDHGVALASNFIGDDDWQGFVEQLQEEEPVYG